jgi:nitrate/nitrite-specific signal transduction histidine kinase
MRIRENSDGIPMDIPKVGRSGHFGLSGMRKRVLQTDAKFDTWSSPAMGTEIDLSFPSSIAYGPPVWRLRLRLFRKRVE